MAKKAEVLPFSPQDQDKLREWLAYWRDNPHHFVRDVYGVDLKLFQDCIFWQMFDSTIFVYIASRGQGKTFLTALFAHTMAVLYPGSKIGVFAYRKKQAEIIITEKIMRDMWQQYPAIRSDISWLDKTAGDMVLHYKNGSSIIPAAANDGSRGMRLTVAVRDEYRMMNPDVDKKVISPMLTEQRKPGYLKKPEYAHLEELNTSIYLSSAWMKNHWSYGLFMNEMKKMSEIDVSDEANHFVKENRSYVIGLPWDVSLYEGLLKMNKAKEEMSAEGLSRAAIEMEYLALFYGQAEGAFFELDDVTKNRTLMKPFIPKTSMQLLLQSVRTNSEKKNSYFNYDKKKHGEIRLISADVARVKGKNNDASSFGCIRLIETNNGYEAHIVYMESHEGMRFKKQGIRLRQLFEEFEADYIVVDVLGQGSAIFDELTQYVTDDDTGRTWEPWNTIKPDQLDDGRSIPRDAPKVIYPMRANQALNFQIALNFKSALDQGKVKLLKSDLEARDIYRDQSDFQELGIQEQAHILKPFIETSEFEREITNLISTQTATTKVMTITETPGNRKDRYSMCSYAYFVALQFERDILRPRKNGDSTLNLAKSMMSAMNNKANSFGGLRMGRRR